jgi:hypothetical protein
MIYNNAAQNCKPMKYPQVLLLSIAIITLSTCGEDLPEINRTVESFSNDAFITPLNNFIVEDVVEAADGGLLVVGSARPEGGGLSTPTILRLDGQRAVEWSQVLDIDQQNIYRTMRIILTLDNEYTVLTMSSPSGASNYNIDLTKINTSGDIIWHKRIEENDKDVRPRAIVQLADEDYLIFSTVIVEQPGTVLEEAHNQLQLDRVSPQGDLIWTKTIEDSTAYSGSDLIYFPGDNSVIAMSTSSPPLLKEGKVDLHKFDLEGNVLWKETVEKEFPVFSAPSSLSKVSSDHFIVLFSASINDASGLYHTVFLKMNLEGNTIWEQNFRTNRIDIAKDAISTSDDGLLLLTQTSSFGNGGYDAMLSKLDENGEVLWEKTYGGSASDHPGHVLEGPNGNFTILGLSNERSGLDNVFDMMVFETDSQGNPQ